MSSNTTPAVSGAISEGIRRRTANLRKGKPFTKGVSGNPSGRPARQIDVEKLAKEQTPAAIKALVTALKYPRERVPAAIALLDRGWGKPKQPIAGDADRPLIVDFRWADGASVTTIDGDRVADAVAEQISIAFDDSSNGESGGE